MMGSYLAKPKDSDLAILRERLLFGADDDIRYEAADALADSGDPAAMPALLRGITDPCEVVRLNVALALGRIGVSNADVVGGLCCLLADVDRSVRRFPLESLGDLGDASALPALRTRLIGEHREPAVRVWVYYALHKLDSIPFPLTEVIALLRKGSTLSRISAATVLSRIATSQNSARICRALRRALARETTDGLREVMEDNLALASATEIAVAAVAGRTHFRPSSRKVNE